MQKRNIRTVIYHLKGTLKLNNEKNKKKTKIIMGFAGDGTATHNRRFSGFKQFSPKSD